MHGIVRRASQPNTQRIEHMYGDRATHTMEKMILHYGDLTDSTCLVKIITKVCACIDLIFEFILRCY